MNPGWSASRGPGWPATGPAEGWIDAGGSLAEIHVLQRLIDLEGAQQRDGVLQFVTLLAGHSQFIALDRGLNLQLAVLQILYQALGQFTIDALLDDPHLAHLVARGALRILEFERRGVDL